MSIQGRAGAVYGSSWVYGHQGGDVGSGFCRKDGLGGGGSLWELAGIRTLGEATWVPAFAAETGGVAVAMGTRGYTDIGRRRGFRVSS